MSDKGNSGIGQILGVPVRTDNRCPPGFIGLIHAPKPERFNPLLRGRPMKRPEIEVFVICAPNAVWRLFNLDETRRGCPTDAEGWEG